MIKTKLLGLALIAAACGDATTTNNVDTDLAFASDDTSTVPESDAASTDTPVQTTPDTAPVAPPRSISIPEISGQEAQDALDANVAL